MAYGSIPNRFHEAGVYVIRGIRLFVDPGVKLFTFNRMAAEGYPGSCKGGLPIRWPGAWCRKDIADGAVKPPVAKPASKQKTPND